MATIRKRGDKWQARVQRRGYPEESRSFPNRGDAEKWARAIEAEIDRGVFVSIKEAERTTLADVLLRYSREVSPHKRAAKDDIAKLKWLAKQKVAKLSLANLTPAAIALHRDQRLKSVSTGTVLRDLAVIRSVLNHARKEWGFAFENPVERIRMPASPPNRDRVLSADEENRLLDVLTVGALRNPDGRFSNATRNPWVRWVVLFALETAMRRGEILALQWKHIDIARRTALLPMTKNGRPRSVPLSSKAIEVLSVLPRSIDGRVFPIARWTVEQVFAGACERAGIAGLRFHDLRHTATSRMATKIPNLIELSAITGHANLSMLRRYYHVTAEELARKLG
jgi:integrase